MPTTSSPSCRARTGTALLALLCLGSIGSIVASHSLSAEQDPSRPLPRETRLHRIADAPELGAGLTLRDGRRLVHGPRSLQNRYPYLVAANESELARKVGYELTVSSVFSLLEPVETEAQAVRLVRWILGGDVVPDRAAFDRIAAVVRDAKLPKDSWTVRVEDHLPQHFGLAATREGNGFVVRGTIFTTSGYGALNVEEVTFRIPNDAPASLERTRAILGPPQSWQTSGEVDQEEQSRLYAAIQGLRDAMLTALRADLTLAPFREIFAKEPRWHEIRIRIGEPNRIEGSGRSFGVYSLGNGNVVVIPGYHERVEPTVASVHTHWSTSEPIGALVETLGEER